MLATALLVGVGSSDTQAQEDFETAVPPTGWVEWQATAETNSWVQSTARANSPTNSAFFDDFNGNNDVWLISNAHNLSGFGSATLDYYENIIFGNWAVQHNVKISTDYAGTGDPALATWTTLNAVIGTEDVWVLKSFDISAHLGAATYVAFQYVGNWASEWYIDDFLITGVVAGSSTLTAGATAEPATISSITDTQGEAVLNFDFVINDDGGTPVTDLVATQFNTLSVKQGAGNDIADWTTVLDGAELTDGTSTYTGVISATTIDFSSIANAGAADLGFVADNGNKTYTLKVWLQASPSAGATMDGDNLDFNVVSSSFTLEGGSSGFGVGETESSGATNNEIDVTATQLTFTGQPSTTATSGVVLVTQPIVSATDANGNVDNDITSSVTLSNSGSLGMSNTSMNFVAGVANFGTPNNFLFTTGGAYVTLSATDGSLSSLYNSTEIAVDIVACPLFVGENFESYTLTSDLNADGLGWDFVDVSGTSTNDWGIAEISANKKLTIHNNTNAFKYRGNQAAEQIAYYATKIDATNFQNLTISFDWQCTGSAGDYGTLVWCTGDPQVAANWSMLLPVKLNGQAAFTNSGDVPIAVCDGQQFYFGFKWTNDGSGRTNPPLGIDNIEVEGYPAFGYNFSYREDDFEPLVGTILTLDGNGSVDVNFPGGFDFKYDGTAVASIRVNENGWIDLSSSEAGAAATNLLANTGQVPFLAPFWDDITMDAQSQIVYYVSGNAPTRRFKIEWTDVLWGGERQTFQVQLYESSYVIEFWYGTMNTNAGGSASIGINNAGGCLNKLISVSPGVTPTSSYTAENSGINSATYLTSGLVYIFNPLEMQSYLSWQPATIVQGQVDFNTTNTVASQTVAEGASSSSVSSKGVFASGSTHSNRVLIWNSLPVANGTPADVVLGQVNFTATASGTTASTLKGISNLCFTPDGDKMIVVDGYNNRVLIWNSIPTVNGTAADVVIGQPDFTTGTSGSSAIKMNFPTGAIVLPNGKLLITDFINNRVLVYNKVPTTNGVAADYVIGQPDLTTVSAGTTANKLGLPWDCAYTNDGKLLISDDNSHRILIYNEVPELNGKSADLVIGNTVFGPKLAGSDKDEFDQPSVTTSVEGKIAIADFGNSRIMMYDRTPKLNGEEADFVLGQPNFYSKTAFNDGYNNTGTADDKNMYLPYSICFDLNGRLYVNGTDNLGTGMHRIMIYGETPTETNDLAITIASNETDVCVLADVTYTVQVTNNGPDVASSVYVNAQLPVGINISGYDATLGTYNERSGYWTIPFIAVGETVTLTFEGEVQPSLSGTSVIAYANILASKQADSDFSNNGANQVINVNTFYTPTTSAIADQNINTNSHTDPVVSFVVDDIDGIGDIVSYTVTSSNTSLIPVSYFSNFVFDGVAPNKTLDITPQLDAYGVDSVTLIITDSHGCHREEEFVVNVGNIWQGTVDDEWENRDNWSIGRPKCSLEAFIPTSPKGGVFPVITNDASCKDLYIEPRAYVTLETSFSLDICEDFIIKSDINGTGAFVDLTSDGVDRVTVTGETTVERYLTSDGWHYVSPFSPNINNESFTQSCGSYNGYLITYDESVNTDTDLDGDTDWMDCWNWPWYSTQNANSLTVGTGYGYYPQSALTCSNTITMTDPSGDLNTGDVIVTINNTDDTQMNTGGTYGDVAGAFARRGWNLIGNPYPSAINLDKFLSDNNSEIDGTAYFWGINGLTNLAASDYATFNKLGSAWGSTGVTPDIFLSASQAFIVHKTSTGSGSVTFKNSQREVENSYFYRDASEEPWKLFFNVKNEDGLYNDIIVGFTDDATNGIDPQYDGYKLLGNADLALYSLIGEKAFAIQGLPKFNNSEFRTVNLGLHAGVTGDYEFSVISIQKFPAFVEILFEDKETGIFTNLRETPSVSVTISESGFYHERFTLHFNVNTAPQLEFPAENQITDEDAEFIYVLESNMFSDINFNDEVTTHVKMQNGEEIPSWLNYNNTNMTFIGIPNNSDVGTYDLQVIGTDSYGAETSDNFVLRVQNINDAPYVHTGLVNQETDADNSFSYTFENSAFADDDINDVLSYTAELSGNNEIPSWLTFNSSTRTFEGTPSESNVGVYVLQVTVTDIAGETATGEFLLTVKSTVSTGNLGQSGVSIYPNPSNGQFVINVDKLSDYTLEITDVTGKIILKDNVTTSSKTVDLKDFAKGVYFVKLTIDGEEVKERIIIE